MRLSANRIAAVLGCVALFACSIWVALLTVPRSWRDLADASVRMRIFRFHVYDWDFIWSAIAFGTVAVSVAAMFAFCFWMVWVLLRHWDALSGRKGR